MELDEFVATTLEQIVRGVASAQSAVQKMNNKGVVNPKVRVAPTGRLDSNTETVLQDVHFDVVVTVSESGKSGAGLQVGAFGIGAQIGG